MVELAPVPAGVGGGGAASLIRDLASCNKTTRDRALKLVLKTWLPAKCQAGSSRIAEVDEDEMKKLWKGLFYCVWHADKSPVQADLIDRLASLLLTLHHPISFHYLSVFFLTLRREWSGIDALRLDKFYLLIRRFLHCSFLMLKKNYCWDLDVSRRLMNLIGERTFFADDKLATCNGVNYHVASIFLEELKPFLPLRYEILDVVFKPFLCVMGKCQDKVLWGKVKSNVFDVLMKMGRSLLGCKKLGDNNKSDDSNEVVVLGTIGLMMGFSTKFYDLGTSPDCIQGNRKVLFDLHEGFLRLEKDVASSGIEISILDAVVDESDVPSLIPIATELEGTSSDAVLESGSKRKSKKASNVQLDGPNKKALKKKKKNKGILELCSAFPEKEIAPVANRAESFINVQTNDESNLIFNDSVISNLRMQFEKVAEGVTLGIDGATSFDSPEATIRSADSKKRKRGKTIDAKGATNQDASGKKDGRAHASAQANGSEKSAKKVSFSMNNLVWKPQNPLPPQSLRLPPSVTPRGSALKKGVPPGPVREMSTTTKKAKQKKSRKGVKTISPAIKRLCKLRTGSV